MNPYRLHAYILLTIVALIWGAATVVIKLTLGGIPALPFLAYRFALSSVFALLFFIFFGHHFPKKRRSIILLLTYGFLNSTIALGLLFLGLEETTVLEMSLISLIAPLMVVIAGVVFLNERVTLQEKSGVGIALLGTIFTVFEPIFANGNKLTRFSGNILILLSLAVSTASAVMAKKLLKNNVSPVVMTNVSFIIGFLTITLILVIKQTPQELVQSIGRAPLPYHLGVFFMALISGNLAYTLAYKAQKTVEIGEAAIFSYLSPIFSAPLAVLILGEKISLHFTIGAVIIIIGVIIAEYKKTKLKN